MPIHQSINQFSAAAIQSILERVLKLDVESHAKLKPFDGKVVHMKITNLELEYYFIFNLAGVLVQSEYGSIEQSDDIDNSSTENQPVSVSISGALSAFITAATAADSSDSLFEGDLHFSGELNTAKQFQKLASSLEIDWQEPVARIFGDPVAHTLATGLSELSSWISHTAQSASMDFSEYAQEEAKLTPSDSEQQLFFDEVDTLRSQIDRLDARVARLVAEQSDSRANP